MNQKTATELAREFIAKWPNACVDEETMRGWFQIAMENGVPHARNIPHNWTPDETQNKCTVCGDGPWGRHRFQSIAHPNDGSTPEHPRLDGSYGWPTE